jgi:hypothetical protein
MVGYLEWSIGKNMEGNSYGFFQDTNPAYTWKDCKTESLSE